VLFDPSRSRARWVVVLACSSADVQHLYLSPFQLSLSLYSRSLVLSCLSLSIFSLFSLSLSSHFSASDPLSLSLPPSGGGPQDTAHKPDQASENQRQRPWLFVIDQIERNRERVRTRARYRKCAYMHTRTHTHASVHIYMHMA